MATEHAAIQELLGAYALDAVDPDEAEVIDRHLDGCPRCRAEVDGYRETAAALGTLAVVDRAQPPPPGLWDRIAGGLTSAPDRPGPATPRFLRELEPDQILGVAGPAAADQAVGSVVDIRDGRPGTGRRGAGRHGAGRHGPGRRGLRWAVAAVTVAATVAAVVLGINLSRTDGQLARTRSALAVASSTAGGGSAAARAALRQPGHRLVRLDSPGGTQLAELVIASGGRGYLVSSSMPPLPADRTYQLWGLFSGRPISLGLMGSHPEEVTFSVAGSTQPSALAVTDEPAGGTVAPTQTPVASGDVVS